jgi:alkanesulfonate monooxygenase SsuD/methylene tetrahydromethanopterin reductase-like flavin-dependent oxidoreductase (luciferase family)
MTDYGSRLEFGLSITPETAEIEAITHLSHVADASGLDLVAIQDHAYNHTFLDTWTLIAFLAAKTERVHFLPDVADLPLRPPAMLAKAVATLDQLTHGRAELGVGAGAFWDAIAGMGGPARTPPQAVEATEEALGILRQAFVASAPVVSSGRYYEVLGYRPGPPPAHPMRIWVGAVKPRMLGLVGRIAGGWVSPLNIYLTPREVPRAHRIIDTAAVEAGREPHDVRRLYNVVGSIGARAGGQGLNGPVSTWTETLAAWALELGLDTFVFWPVDASERQVRLFAEDVVPRVRELVDAARSRTLQGVIE